MRAKPLQIHWHARQAIFSCDFQPTPDARLATAGGDMTVRLWRIQCPSSTEPPTVKYLSTLGQHVGPGGVNCVRWSPDGLILATAGDDRVVLLWKLALNSGASRPSTGKSALQNENEDENAEEEWKAVRQLIGCRGEIYDLSWSPCGRYIAAGCLDSSVVIFGVDDGKVLQVLSDHTHFVQGVAWDPLGEYLATQGSDRTMLVYRISFINPGSKIQVSLIAKHSRVPSAPAPTPTLAPVHPESSTSTTPGPPPAAPRKRHARRFLPDTMGSFFRRCGWSPDGGVLIGVAGTIGADAEEEDENGQSGKGKEIVKGVKEGRNTAWLWGRGNLTGLPIAHLPTSRKAPIAFRPLALPFAPAKPSSPATTRKPFLALPGYRIVSAMVGLDSVAVYDSEQANAVALVAGLHLAALTDCAWSPDGTYLVMTSMDGYCSVVNFAADELGQVLPKESWPKGRWARTVDERAVDALVEKRSVEVPGVVLVDAKDDEDVVMVEAGTPTETAEGAVEPVVTEIPPAESQITQAPSELSSTILNLTGPDGSAIDTNTPLPSVLRDVSDATLNQPIMDAFPESAAEQGATNETTADKPKSQRRIVPTLISPLL